MPAGAQRGDDRGTEHALADARVGTGHEQAAQARRPSVAAGQAARRTALGRLEIEHARRRGAARGAGWRSGSGACALGLDARARARARHRACARFEIRPRAATVASVRAAARSSSSRWVAITARRSRDVIGGTVGGRIAWANTPRASAASQIAHRQLGVADDQRDDLGPRAGDVKSLVRERGAHRGRVGGELLDPRGPLLEQRQRGQRARHGRRRQRGREDERARRVDQVARHLASHATNAP